MTSLYSPSDVPGGLDNADGTAYTLCEEFESSVAGNITAGRWRFPTTTPSASVPVRIGVFRVSDQALLGSATFPLASTPGQWNQVAFGSSIAIAADTLYRIAVWTPLRYVNTASYYNSPVTVGTFTSSATNGFFVVGGTDLAYPNSPSGNHSTYWADFVFAPNAAAVDLIFPRRPRRGLYMR